jgi:hypothetical protein
LEGQSFKKNTDACQACDAGTFGESPGNCTVCPSGFYQENKNSVECIECTIGKQYVSASTQCTDCEAGKFGESPGNCTECPSGYYQEIKKEVECIFCTIGKQYVVARTACAGCDVGRYGDIAGNCTDCMLGSYQDTKGSTECKKCRGAVNSITSCQPCGLGKSTGGPNAVAKVDDKTTCVQCPSGKYQDAEQQLECKECVRGFVPNIAATSCISLKWLLPEQCAFDFQYLDTTAKDNTTWKCKTCFEEATCYEHSSTDMKVSILGKQDYWRVPGRYYNGTGKAADFHFMRCPFPDRKY